MKFRFPHQDPFIPLTIALIAGILSAFTQVSFKYCLLIFGLVMCVALVLHYVRKRSYVFLIGLFGTLYCIGFGLLSLARGDFEKKTLSNSYRPHDMLVCEVTEVGDTTKPWVKTWLTAHQVIQQNHVAIAIHSKLIGYIEGGKSIRLGDQLLLGSKPERIRNAGNPGEFDAEYYWNGKGIAWQTFAGKGMYMQVGSNKNWSLTSLGEPLRRALSTGLKQHLKDRERAIALALILGDRSELDADTTMSFVNTGAMHVLAVSGLHIGILMSILLFLLVRLNRFITRKQATLLVVLLMWLYALITGMSPSVVRAVYMFSILALAQVFGKQYRSLNTLFFTAFSLLMINPFTLFDIGFQLSFLAMLGIYLFYKPIAGLFYFDQKILNWLWSGTAVGFAAQLLTTPISLYYFHQFPNYFVLTNLGLMASTGIILGGGLLLMTFFAVPYLSAGIAWLLSGSISFSYWIIEAIEGLPGAVAYGFTPNMYWVGLSAAVTITLFYKVKLRSIRVVLYGSAVVLLSVLVFVRYRNLSRNELCILSSNKTVVLFKSGESVTCFYWCKPNKFKDVRPMVADYTKIHPGEVVFCSLKKNWKLHQNGEEVSFRQMKWGTSISLNGKQIQLIRNANLFQNSTKGVRVFMPWVQDVNGHRLSECAYRLKV